MNDAEPFSHLPRLSMRTSDGSPRKATGSPKRTTHGGRLLPDRVEDVVPPLVHQLVESDHPNAVMWLAPHGPSLAHLPVNVQPTSLTEAQLDAEIAARPPRTLVVADQNFSAASLRHWASVTPNVEKKIVRRGASLNGIPAPLCAELGISVVSLPGVNAAGVAAFASHALRTSPAGGRSTPERIGVLGDGAVGRALVRDLLSHSAADVTLFARTPKPLATLGVAEKDATRVRVVGEMQEAFAESDAVAVCVALNAQTRGIVNATHVAAMRPGGHLLSLSRPDVLDDGALHALASDGSAKLSVDYGALTIADFRTRLAKLGMPEDAWKHRIALTATAVTGPQTVSDLDNAALTHAAQSTVDRYVAGKIADPTFSFRIRERTPTEGPVEIAGRGIQGLFQALVMHNAGYDVTVIGKADGASHHANIRHGSALETAPSASNVESANPARIPHDAALVVRMNMWGVKLMRDVFLRDNPEFASDFTSGLVRAYVGKPDDAANEAKITKLLQAPEQQQIGFGGMTPLPPERFAADYGMKGVTHAVEMPGYSVRMRSFMAKLEARLATVGVRFTDARLDSAELHALRDRPSVIAIGADDARNAHPLPGWFTTLPLHPSEAIPDGKGLKLLYDDPVGAMNVMRDGAHVHISGGFVKPGSSAAQEAAVLEKVRTAIGRHFPKSARQAATDGSAVTARCERPASTDGIPVIRRTGQSVAVTGTTAGGTTLAPLLALLAHDALAERRSAPGDDARAPRAGNGDRRLTG